MRTRYRGEALGGLRMLRGLRLMPDPSLRLLQRLFAAVSAALAAAVSRRLIACSADWRGKCDWAAPGPEGVGPGSDAIGAGAALPPPSPAAAPISLLLGRNGRRVPNGFNFSPAHLCRYGKRHIPSGSIQT